MSQILRHTVFLLRAYVRDRTALFFSLLLPLVFMLIFGALNLGAFGHVNVGIVDQAANADSARLITSLKGIDSLRITVATEDEQRARLIRGDRDLVIVIPADFRIAPVAAASAAPVLTVWENAGKPQEVGVGEAILTQFVDQTTFAVTRTAPVLTLKREAVAAHDLRYVDFVVPGIIGMSVMQLGIFSVAFGFVAWKQRGVLKRIMATPLRPARLLAAHVLMRLLMSVAQVLILVGVAVLVFHVQFVGSILSILALTILGSLVFLCIGFAVAGRLSTEDQVPPIANLITLPQFFLSGVFFPRDAVPEIIRPITGYLPLSFLNDALREVATQGATLWDVRGDMLGMAAWVVVCFFLAIRFFKLGND